MKRHYLLSFFVLVFSAFFAISCDDTTETIGSGIAGNLDNFTVSTDTFTLTTRTVKADSVLARCANARLGCIRDPETGALIKCSYMTQFYIMEGRSFPELDSLRSFTDEAKEELYQKNEEGKYNQLKPLMRKVNITDIVADSIQLIVYPISIVGDSLQPMRLSVHEMNRPLLEDRKFYSDFDPIKEGFVDESKWMKKKTFTFADQTTDSTETSSSNYSTYFRIPLNQEYDDGKGNVLNNGKPFNNYGTYILRKYYDGMAKGTNHFKDFNTFIHNVCPGVYIRLENGTGALATIRGTGMNLYFKVWGNDTIPYISSYSTFFGTEEILQTTNYETNKEVIEKLAEDQTCSYLKTPAGLYTEAKINILDIIIKGGADAINDSINYYKMLDKGLYSDRILHYQHKMDSLIALKDNHLSDSLSSVKVAFRCMNYESMDNYKFANTSNILMIPADSVTTFFENQKLTDGHTSFLSSYSSSSNSYVFNNISGIVSYLYKIRANGIKSNPDWETERDASGKLIHENWNKVALIPVETTTSTTGSISAIYHNLGLSSTKLVGGAKNPIEPIKVSVVYYRLSD